MSIAARAAGDTRLRHDAQRTINALMDRYDKIADAAGIDTQYSRMRVSGFKHTSDKELRKTEKTDILNSIRETIKSGAVSKTINAEKQNRHIKDAEGYTAGRSYIYGDLNTAQRLVGQYSGTGEPQIDKNGKWKNKEVVMAESDIGVNVDKNSGTEISTNRFVIHYSKTGTHIVPTSRMEEKK